MTPAQLLDTFATPLEAYERTRENLLGALGSAPVPERPWDIFGTHLRTYWAGLHTGENIPTVLFRTPGGAR